MILNLCLLFKMAEFPDLIPVIFPLISVGCKQMFLLNTRGEIYLIHPAKLESRRAKPLYIDNLINSYLFTIFPQKMNLPFRNELNTS